MPDRLLVLWPGARPEPLRWESQVQDIGPPSNCESSPRDLCLNPKTQPRQQQQASLLDATCQTTSKTRTEHHPLAERLPKITLSSQTPQNTPLDTALPTRKKDPGPPTKTQAPVLSTRKPTQPTEPTLPTGGRHQKQWELQTCRLQKGDSKHSKLS